MDFSITFLGDGILFGCTYFGKNDRIEEYDDEDWNEFNIYLFLVQFKFRWW